MLLSGQWVNVELVQASVTPAGACWVALEVTQISMCSCPNGKAATVAVPACLPGGGVAEPCLPHGLFLPVWH